METFYTIRKNVFCFLALAAFLSLTFHQKPLFGQEYSSTVRNRSVSLKYAPEHIVKNGTLLFTLNVNRPNVLGVTVVNNKIIIATGGDSSASKTDNYFYRYSFNGVLLDSFPQPTQIDGYGYRDLAFNGAYILASDNSEIRFIDTVNFKVHHSINYPSRALHRGLAADMEENSIWSLNSWSGPLIKLDAATGMLMKSLATPTEQVFGIALEKTTASPKMNIWYAEPWGTGNRIIRLTRIDTATGNPDFSYDLAPNFTENTLVGGLDIISNHPAFPGKTVALLVEQLSRSIVFIELSEAQPVFPSALINAGSLGGWVNSAAIKGNNAFLAQGNDVNVVDISGSGFTSLNKLGLPAASDGYVISGNYLYMFHPSYENDYKNYIEVVDITNPVSPVIVNSYRLELADFIVKIGISGNQFLALAKKNDSSKVIKLNISNPAAISVTGAYPVEAIDMVVSGGYAFLIGGSLFSTGSNSLLIYDIGSGFNLANKTIIQGATSIYYTEGRAHIACEGANGYHLYDVSNTSMPSFLGSFGVGAQSFNNVFAYGNLTYLKKNYSILIILDHSNPSNIQQLGSLYLGTFSCVEVKDNLLYAVAGGGLQSINISNPGQPVSVTKQNTPVVSSGIAIKGTTVYCAEEGTGIYIFDASNPEEPVYKDFLSLLSTNKVFCYGNLLLVTDNMAKLRFYDISNPFTPVLKSTYSARGDVKKAVIKGDCVYIITNNSNKMDVISIADITAPVKIAEHSFQSNQIGVDLAASPLRQHIYAITKPAAYIQAYIELIDVAAPASPRYITRKYGFDKAEGIEVVDDIIFVLENGRSYPGAKIYAVNSADTVSMATLNSRVLSATSDGSGLLVLGDYIFVSLGADKKLISVGWDKQTKLLFVGPGNTQPEPADNAGILVSSTQQQNSPFDIADEKLYGIIYTINGGYYNGNLSGSKSIKITRIKIPVQILPPDKKAILTLGCKSENILLCTSDFPDLADTSDVDDLTKNICEFSVTASIDDDWNLMSIKFSANGLGHDSFHISKVRLYTSNNQLLSEGTYSQDDGTITMNINKVLSAGQSMSFILEYQFPQFLRYLDHVETYSVTTKADWIAATPLHLTKYEKLPPTIFNGNTIMIASVFNNRTMKGFAKIQEAINDGGTINGDVLNICPCLFKEEPIVTKSLTLKGSSNYILPIIQPPGEKSSVLVTLEADSISLENIIFDGLKSTEYLASTTKDMCKKINLLNNRFVNAYQAVYIKDAVMGGNIYKNSFSNIIYDELNLQNSNYMNIWENSFGRSNFGVLIEYESNFNKVFNNKFVDVVQGVFIYKSNNNKIYQNTFTKVNEYLGREIEIRAFGKNNEIYENRADESLSGIYSSAEEPNLIYNNTFPSIYLAGSRFQTVLSNNVKRISLLGGQDNIIQFNEISHSVDYGISLREACSNIIRDNSIFECSKDGIMVGTGTTAGASNKNLFVGNKIYKNNGDGIRMISSSFNTFEDNEIYENRDAGIACVGYLFGGSENNVFVDNLLYKNNQGIMILESKNCVVDNCKIRTNDYRGLLINHSSNIKVLNSDISFHTPVGAGINLFQCSDYVIAGNLLEYNCTGIELTESPNGVIRNNRVLHSTCSNTGISMSNSNPVLMGNSIDGNNGAGIYAELDANPVIMGNNITGNTGGGIVNNSPAININAQGNWWGRSTGPIPTDIAGSVTSAGWLLTPLVFVCTKESDTLLVTKGTADTGSVDFSNMSSVKDTISVTFSDEKGWLKTTGLQKMLFDTANARFNFAIEAPADLPGVVTNKIKINAQFNGSVLTDSIYVTAYAANLFSINLMPDSTTITKGDTLRFSWIGLDQYGKEVGFLPKFSATGGVIDSLGVFVSDTVSGSVKVTVSDLAGSIKDESLVNVTNERSVLTKITVSPKEISILTEKETLFKAIGTDQYGFAYSFMPEWSATGGAIDGNGYYSAGTVKGKYFVVARDTASGLTDTAFVTVLDVIPVELALFTAEYKNKKVQLNWKTITETNNKGFEILRSPRILAGENVKPTLFEKVGFIAGKINSTAEVLYSFTDNSPLKNGNYKYCLKQIDLDGTYSYSPEVTVIVKVLSYRFEQNYPNPFNPITNIEYALPAAGKVCIEVYNSLGQRVDLLKDELHEAGNYKLQWNGARFASGAYFIRILAERADSGKDKFTSVKKMLLVK